MELFAWQPQHQLVANTGAKKSVIEVRAERVQFMGAPGGAKAAEQGSQIHAQVEPSAMPEEPSSESTWLAESEDEVHEG